MSRSEWPIPGKHFKGREDDREKVGERSHELAARENRNLPSSRMLGKRFRRIWIPTRAISS